MPNVPDFFNIMDGMPSGLVALEFFCLIYPEAVVSRQLQVGHKNAFGAFANVSDHVSCSSIDFNRTYLSCQLNCLRISGGCESVDR